MPIKDTKLRIYDECFDLVYYGRGFTWTEVYSMPVYLRHYYIKKIIKIKNDEWEAANKGRK